MLKGFFLFVESPQGPIFWPFVHHFDLKGIPFRIMYTLNLKKIAKKENNLDIFVCNPKKKGKTALLLRRRSITLVYVAIVSNYV